MKGICTVCMGVTQSYAGLVVCRFLLGFFEAGFVPGEFRVFELYEILPNYFPRLYIPHINVLQAL